MERILIVFVLLVPFYGFSQVELRPGVRGGINYSRFTNTEGNAKTDFYIGGLLGIKLAKFYTLQPELTYSRQGTVVKMTTSYFNGYDPLITPKTIKEKYNIDYLSIGVNNKFTFGPGIQLMIGPTIDFKVKDNFINLMNEEIIGVDLTLVAGLGYDFGNGIAIEGRFKQGMIDIFGENYNQYNDSNGNGNYEEVILNQLFQLGVSYSFDVKNK